MPMHTRHAGLIAVAIIEASKGLAALCGEAEFVEGLQTGEYFAIAMTVIDYGMARIKNARGNPNA